MENLKPMMEEWNWEVFGKTKPKTDKRTEWEKDRDYDLEQADQERHERFRYGDD